MIFLWAGVLVLLLFQVYVQNIYKNFTNNTE